MSDLCGAIDLSLQHESEDLGKALAKRPGMRAFFSRRSAPGTETVVYGCPGDWSQIVVRYGNDKLQRAQAIRDWYNRG